MSCVDHTDVDLTACTNSQVKTSIAYVSDWSVQGLGVFVDDVVVSTGEGTTSFESDLDGRTITLYFGFGFEGISGAATRNAVMDRSMDYLLG